MIFFKKGGIYNQEQIKEILMDILYYACKNDISFPRSCGIVSTLFAYFFKDTELAKDYEIVLVRGVYRNENEADFGCDDISDDIDRYHCQNWNHCCVDCGCDYMNPHSWIEIQKGEKTAIIDATKIQFEDDFVDYQEYLLKTKLTKEKLFDYLDEHSTMFLEESSEDFKNYIVVKVKTISQLVKLVEEDNRWNGMIENFLKWKTERLSDAK